MGPWNSNMVWRKGHKTTHGTKNQFTCGAFRALLYQYPPGESECDEGDCFALVQNVFFFPAKKNQKARRAINSLILTSIYLASWCAGSLVQVSCSISFICRVPLSLVSAWNQTSPQLEQYSATVLCLFEMIFKRINFSAALRLCAKNKLGNL